MNVTAKYELDQEVWWVYPTGIRVPCTACVDGTMIGVDGKSYKCSNCCGDKKVTKEWWSYKSDHIIGISTWTARRESSTTYLLNVLGIPEDPILESDLFLTEEAALEECVRRNERG